MITMMLWIDVYQIVSMWWLSTFFKTLVDRISSEAPRVQLSKSASKNEFEIFHQTAGVLLKQYETCHNVQYMHQYSRMRPASRGHSQLMNAKPTSLLHVSSIMFLWMALAMWSGSTRRWEQDVCVKICQPIPFSQIPLPRGICVNCDWHMVDHEWQSTKFEPI